MSKETDEKPEVDVAAVLSSLNIDGLVPITSTREAGYQTDTDFGMKGIRIAEAVIALAHKTTVLKLMSKAQQKKHTPEEIEAFGKQKVAIISTKTLELAVKATVQAMISNHTKKATWTPEEYDKLTVTVKGQKVPVGVYRMNEHGMLIRPEMPEGRRKQYRAKLKAISNKFGGSLRDKDVAIIPIE